MNNLKQLIKEFRELRAGSAALDGFEENSGMYSSNPNSDIVYFLVGRPSDTCEQDAKFISYASNNITKLLDAMEVLVEALSTLKEPLTNTAITIGQYDNYVVEKATEALQLAEEKVKE